MRRWRPAWRRRRQLLVNRRREWAGPAAGIGCPPLAAEHSKLCGRVCERLSGHHVLVTGSTGFLAKAFVEKLLRSVDTLGGIHLVIRPKSGGLSPVQRMKRDVLGSRAFDRLRALHGGAFDELCERKIHVVPGDLSREWLGLDTDSYKALSERITVIVNSAATVTFDERIDWAVELNALGPSRLLQFARDCGNAPFLHVSTCYVCGSRTGTIVEDFSAPEPARETLPRLDTGEFDLTQLVEDLRHEAATLRERHGGDTEAARKALIDAGMDRARAHGWNDTYTFTKWIGEQLLLRDHGDVPCAIFRPAIIESSYDEPAPGWIDGLRMADPIIVAYGKGKLQEFPARPEIALDLIPVDFVANAMILTLPVGIEQAANTPVYHCASSDRHPVRLAEVSASIERAFRKRPMNDDNGRPIQPGPLRMVDVQTFQKRWRARGRRVQRLRRLIEPFYVARKRVRKLAAISRQIDQLLYFAKIYSPYTHLSCQFADDNLRAVVDRIPEEDRRDFPCDVKGVDWDDYMVNRHVPGIRSFVLGTGWEPSARVLAVDEADRLDKTSARKALKVDNLFEVFQQTAERFPDKHALQIRRNNRWTRYTYSEALRATGSIMRRFLERSLKPGDRVIICGENGPEWGLTYLSIMRAGMTAVPLDPQWPGVDVWQAARFVDAKLVCAGSSTAAGIQSARGDDDAEVVIMAQPFAPPPAASRDQLPDPVTVPDSSCASILFTSGTTVAPKAVQLTHRNFLANAQALVDVHPVYPSDEFLSVLPLYHAFEFTGGFLVPLSAGATITYVEQLKGPEIRSAMQATGTTAMLVVPRLLRSLHEAIMNQVAGASVFTRGAFRSLGVLSNLSRGRLGRRLFGAVHKQFGGRLRIMVSGGSRLDPDLFDSFSRMGFAIYEGYGLTETAPVLSVNPPGQSIRGSVGPVLPNVEIEIRNENLEGVGEVWVMGPNVMSGYLDNPEATDEVLVDGWFRTGDLGRLDTNGFLHLTGRSKDLIITGAGKNVYPDEVESRYGDLPFVTELCVFGMPSPDGLGDSVHAVAVLDVGNHPEVDRSSMEREVRLAVEAVSETLPPYQRIAVIHFWDHELPKTSTLKAKRSRIRDIVRSEGDTTEKDVETTAKAEREPETIDNPDAMAAIASIVAAHAKNQVDVIEPKMHLLLDLGIDSIGKMEVLGNVEAQFRTQIDDEKAAKISRVADILHLVGDRKPSAPSREAKARARRATTPDRAASATNGQLAGPLMPVRWLVRGSLSLFMSSYVRVHVSGRENIPDNGAFILAPNHSSHLDSPSTIAAIGRRRRVWIAGAQDYFFNTALKRFLFGKILDTISFDRKADGVRGLRRCGEALSRGDGLLIYPEGTRSITGDIQPFKVGVAFLAVERGVPVIPVYIHRTYNLFRKGQRIVRPGKVRVHFGTPIYPPARDAIEDRYKAFHDLAAEIEDAVRTMRREVVG